MSGIGKTKMTAAKYLLIILTLLLGACVVPPPRGGEDLSAAAPPAQAQQVPARPVPEDGLGAPAFRNLPGEAGAYLKILAEAFG